ncbi:Cleavage and polyadenylation specificity factor subunit 4 [Dictyocoela muelleri]|nr:Cleavage and polyadenylation specificity factor subunit 4 [Dictyocoela muelleri]
MEQPEIEFDFEDFIKNKLNLVEVDNIYCEKFQKNECYNYNCPKIHIKLDKAVVCKHWLRGLCKRDIKCDFLHEYNLKKMPECFFFSKYGECSNQECIFLHVDPNSQAKECPWYNRGFCKHGLLCKNRHIKRKMCHNYLLGFCIKGPDCQFAHPRFDVPDACEQRTKKEKDALKKPSNLVDN